MQVALPPVLQMESLYYLKRKRNAVDPTTRGCHAPPIAHAIAE